MKRAGALSPDILQNVRWSTQHALADSAASLRTRNMACVATLQDVDTLDDLTALNLQR